MCNHTCFYNSSKSGRPSSIRGNRIAVCILSVCIHCANLARLLALHPHVFLKQLRTLEELFCIKPRGQPDPSKRSWKPCDISKDLNANLETILNIFYKIKTLLTMNCRYLLAVVMLQGQFFLQATHDVKMRRASIVYTTNGMKWRLILRLRRHCLFLPNVKMHFTMWLCYGHIQISCPWLDSGTCGNKDFTKGLHTLLWFWQKVLAAVTVFSLWFLGTFFSLVGAKRRPKWWLEAFADIWLCD